MCDLVVPLLVSSRGRLRGLTCRPDRPIGFRVSASPKILRAKGSTLGVRRPRSLVSAATATAGPPASWQHWARNADIGGHHVSGVVGVRMSLRCRMRHWHPGHPTRGARFVRCSSVRPWGGEPVLPTADPNATAFRCTSVSYSGQISCSGDLGPGRLCGPAHPVTLVPVAVAGTAATIPVRR
jgi:hypothetical protein